MEWLVALVVGAVQGLLEWLPVSSEGSVALALTALDRAPGTAARFALVLHAGTAAAAAVYYRDTLAEVLGAIDDWHLRDAFGEHTADLSFFLLATTTSGVTGVAGLLVLEEVATSVTGGAFVALIGALLVGTGVFMYVAESRGRAARADGGSTDGDATGAFAGRDRPGPVDAVLVGALQGVAILPGVSRSGTTVGALLLRGHDGPAALRLSFVLSVPAAAGAGAIAVRESGLGGLTPGEAVLALAVSAVVGYLTVDALTRLVARVRFWLVCLGFGALAVVGGGLLLL